MNPSTLRLVKLAVTAIAVLITAACDRTPRGYTAVPIALDSTSRAEKAAFDSAVRALGDSSPQALDSLRNGYAGGIQELLARLGFTEGPFESRLTRRLRDDIRGYERARSLPETGDPLSWHVIRGLSAEVDSLDQQPPILPTKVVLMEPTWASVSGAWAFDNMGGQRNAVEISCDRYERECRETQAMYSTLSGSANLDLHTETLRITSWNDTEIVAQSEYPCTRYVLKINAIQKSATKIRSTISTAQQCAYLQRDDLVIRLLDGHQIAADDTKKRVEVTERLLALTPAERARRARMRAQRAAQR